MENKELDIELLIPNFIFYFEEKTCNQFRLLSSISLTTDLKF
jgi:hypothetical protein